MSKSPEKTAAVIAALADIDNKWTIGDDARRLGQSDEIVDTCMIAGLIPADDQHGDYLDNDVVIAIASHINKLQA